MEFVEADFSSIDSYLFDASSGYQSRDAQKLFDHLDFIFMDGDANQLPWLMRSRKFTLLVKMCKVTQKCLFVCSFAMQALIFLCASSFNIDKVKNGKGRGEPLKSFSNSGEKLLPGEVFLDSVTGDIYCWDPHKQEMKPTANVGIHNHKDAQDNQFKSMHKTNQYRPAYADSVNQVVVGKPSEVKCRIFKQYSQHWLTKGLGLSEFLVPRPNKWDVHPVNATNQDDIYLVLAESQRGPQIILYKNAVGTQFHINKKYPSTLVVLKNYVNHMMARLQTETGRLELPLSTASKLLFSRKNRFKTTEKKTQRSGLAISKRKGQPLTMTINATRSQALKLPAIASSQRFESDCSSLVSDNPLKKSLSTKFMTKRTDLKNDNKEGIIQPLQIEYLETLGSQFIDKLPAAWKSKKEIRRILHPNYPINMMPKKGHLLNGKNLTLSKCDFEYYEKPVVKVVVSSRPYCCKYDDKTPERHIVKRDVYVDIPKQEIREMNENKKKWSSKKNFLAVVRSPSVRVPGFNSGGSPAKEHKFREENQQQWLAGPFKTPSYN